MQKLHTTFYENPYWVHPSIHMTWALYDSILTDLMEPLPQTEIARQNQVTESTVLPVLQSIRFGLPAALPETLCIDEFKGNSGVWRQSRRRWYLNKYHCNISDGASHAVIDVLDQISGVYLHKYFQQFSPKERRTVKYFCCDMSNSFVSLAKKDFPHARICIDPFHIINRLNDMMDTVRRRYQHQFQDSDDTDSIWKQPLPLLLIPLKLMMPSSSSMTS